MMVVGVKRRRLKTKNIPLPQVPETIPEVEDEEEEEEIEFVPLNKSIQSNTIVEKEV